jgi:hypothetical protein
MCVCIKLQFQASQKFLRATMAMFLFLFKEESFAQNVKMKKKSSISVDAYGFTYKGERMLKLR